MEETAAPTATAHVITPAPTEADDHVLAGGRGEVKSLTYGYGGLTEEMLSWKVDSWTVYDSWGAAGVTTEDLAYHAHLEDILLPEPGGGVLIVDYTLTNDSVAIISGSERPMESVMGIYPISTWELESIPTEEMVMDDGETVQALNYYSLLNPPVYYAQTRWREDGSLDSVYYFYLYLPKIGESVHVTLGYLLTADEVEAARNGELFLWCEEAGPLYPTDVSELLLTPLICE